MAVPWRVRVYVGGALIAALGIAIVVTQAIPPRRRHGSEHTRQIEGGTPAPAVPPRATPNLLFARDHPQAAPATGCICSYIRLPGGWCDACQLGYVAGLAIPSQLLYEAVDNHGHDVDPALILCPTCIAAMKTDSLCEACGYGFIGGRLYVTPLAYWLGTGITRDPQRLTCATCRQNVERALSESGRWDQGEGWCEACGVGMVGNAAVSDRTGFGQAIVEFNRLKLAVSRLDGCKWCALATYSNGMCPFCRIKYQDGVGTPMAQKK